MKKLCMVAIIICLAFPTIALGGKVLQKSDFVYLGAFRVPQGSLGGASGPAAQTLRSGDFVQPISYNPARNSLFILGYPEDALTTEITIPAIINPATVSFDVTQLNTASVVQLPVDLSAGHRAEVSKDGTTVSGGGNVYVGGLMEYNGDLIQTAWLYYDASGANSWRSHYRTSANWEDDGVSTSRLYEVGTRLVNSSLANGGYVGGYMTQVPPEWRTAFGAPALTGLSKIPIVTRSSLGPSIWTFNPDELGTQTPTPATALITYTVDHPTLGPYSADTASLYYNKSGGHAGMIFRPGSDSVVVIGHHGFGIQLTDGVPTVNTDGVCSGPGTSNRDEAKSNAWLAENSPDGWTCGAIVMSAADILGGDSCCFDPAGAFDTTHDLPYVVGVGDSCYGLGTSDLAQVRSNAWLRVNSPEGWLCGSATTSAAAITAGDSCCYGPYPGGENKGGKSYPYVYQMWSYNANDLVKVKNGEINPETGVTYQPWDLIPDIWTFDLPFVGALKAISGATYDPLTQRVYLLQPSGDGVYPVVHAFQLNIPLSASGARARYSPTDRARQGTGTMRLAE